jgi:hypothetical protein
MQDVYSLEEIKQGQEALQLLEKMNIQIQPSKHVQFNNTKSGGGIGFIAGLCLAIVAFAVIPIIPVLLAFLAGSWISYNGNTQNK